jgi:hypothetical protein
MNSTTADEILGGGVKASGGSVITIRTLARHCDRTESRP